jgi:3-oxoacyl-[acyl-carrier protein] reductase
MNLDLSQKNALVCGSTQGIGKATAVELALLGANVVLVARNEESLKATLSELDQSKGQKHNYVVADFQQPTALKQSVEALVAQVGVIHILVNNTGGPPAGAIASAKIEEFLQAFNNHLICNHILAQALLEGMKQAGYGRIINVISTSVKLPLKNLGVSNTIRAAVANWSKTLSNEVAKHGITVNNVLPGATLTGRLKGIIENKAKNTGESQDEVKDEMMSEIPMARFADASEVANAIAFLASPAASYITGINVPVDGGRTGCL